MPASHFYKIRYQGANGAETMTLVEAESTHRAIDILGLSMSRVTSIQRDWIREIEARLPKSGPSLSTQTTMLNVFSVQVASGGSPSQRFDSLVAMTPSLKHLAKETERFLKVSEKMAFLKFDPQLVLLAEVGEQSGLVGEVLGRAADELVERIKMISEIRKQLVPSLMLAVIGLMTFIILPIYMAPPIVSLMSQRGIIMKTNICTDILVFVGGVFDHWTAWVASVGLIVGVVYSARHWWPWVRHLYGFRFIDSYFQGQNAYRFLSAFLPLFSRGVPISQTLEMMQRFSRGTTKTVYKDMQQHLSHGGALSNAFTDRFWDPLLSNSMSGFDTMRQEGKLEMLRRLQPLLANEIKKRGEVIGGILNGFGTVLAVGIVIVIFIGMTMPLLTISAPLSN